MALLKKLLLLISIAIQTCYSCANAQHPLVKMWDKNLGGTDDDMPTCFIETQDGGYLIGGYSFSGAGADKSEPVRGASDFWVVKIDGLGNKEWDRTFGGANADELKAMLQAQDGSYLLGGMSASGVSGDKTAAAWGNNDFWILKLDASGNKLWDRSFGGSSPDHLTSMVQTSDGGFLLAGNSASGISGCKSQPSFGSTDYWMIKTDPSGNQIWDKTFGGADSEKLFAVMQTADGGYMLGGASWSQAGGSKSSPSFGMDDYWAVRTDSSGNKIWDGDFGGVESDILFSLVQTPDSGFLLAGRSGSDVSGNKTKPLWGGYDFWLVKVDVSGNKIWERGIGGTLNEDEFGNISHTGDGGFLVAGTSYSPVGGDKSESNLGTEQSWFLKLDSVYSTAWDKTVFTPCHDEIGLAIETDGCYAVLNANGAGCGAGGYRSQASLSNSLDYWIVKFCDTAAMMPVAMAGAAQSLCPGTCVDFQNLSLNSTVWQWNFPGAFPGSSTAENPSAICYAAPGSYDVTLIASNAHSSDTVYLADYIHVNAYPPPQSIHQSGDTLIAIAGASAYQWYFNGSPVSGATNYFYVAPVAGDYNLIATDSNGCEVEAAIFGVWATVESFTRDLIKLFPNPVDDKLHVDLNSFQTPFLPVKISVYNSLGERLFCSFISNIKELPAGFDLQTQPPGLYLIECSSGSIRFSEKFVKR